MTGRDKEVARVIQILARRSKNNPILLGEPGVGKTAIAEGALRRLESRPALVHARDVVALWRPVRRPERPAARRLIPQRARCRA